MKNSRARARLPAALSVFAAASAVVFACGPHKGGIDTPAEGGSTAQGGRDPEPAEAQGGAGSGIGGGPSSAGAQSGGAGGSGTRVEAGAPAATGGAPWHGGGAPGAAGSDDAPGPGQGGMRGGLPEACDFHTEPPEYEPSEPTEPAAGGEGGGGPGHTITVYKNQFVGAHLADGEGKALYAYGRDFPGDCNYPPITHCYDDCAIAWPIFDAVPRLLPPELDPALFGRIERADGTFQTTYRGWPLYYYKNDVLAGDAKGHARGVWHLAEIVLPNIVVIRIGEGDDERRTLADEGGRTLYVYAEDTAGAETTSPLSACSGECLESFQPFMLKYLSPVAYVDEKLLSTFVRADGQQQIAYRGVPLYRSNDDARSGDMNGTRHEGFTWAVP